MGDANRFGIGTGKSQKALLGECPECGFAVQYGWENGKRVCVKGHTWRVDSETDHPDYTDVSDTEDA